MTVGASPRSGVSTPRPESLSWQASLRSPSSERFHRPKQARTRADIQRGAPRTRPTYMADRARQVSASPSNGLAYKPHTGKPERPPRFSRAQERMSDIIRRIEKECFIDRPVPCASDSDLARHMLSEPVVKQTRFGDLDASHGEREQGCQSVIEWRHEYDPQAPATTCRHIVSTLFPAHVHTPQLKARRPVLRHSPDQVRMQRALPVGSDDDDDEGDRSCDDRQDDVLLDSEAARFFQATRELARDVRLLARQDGQTLRHTWDALELDCVEIVKAAYVAQGDWELPVALLRLPCSQAESSSSNSSNCTGTTNTCTTSVSSLEVRSKLHPTPVKTPRSSIPRYTGSPPSSSSTKMAPRAPRTPTRIPRYIKPRPSKV